MLVVVVGLVFGIVGVTTWMPGSSWSEPVPPLSEAETALRGRLEAHVRMLAVTIGERNTRFPKAYELAEEYLRRSLTDFAYVVESQDYPGDGMTVTNLVAERKGTERPGEIVVIGAHYDSVRDTPGADDNASGTAAVLELARHFAQQSSARTLRFVLFANEEPPAFQNEDMGSLVYAKACKARGDDIVAMLSLESIGFFTSEPDTQILPTPLLRPFLGSRGDFLGFVANWKNRPLVRETIAVFREAAPFPTEGIAAPELVSGIGFSDHWSFWQVGYPAAMVTDTALFRNPHYHKPTDLPETMDFSALARVTQGLTPVVAALAAGSERY